MNNETNQDQLLDHNYDGIQEYDNPLPRWWLWLFWISIVFSAFYFVFYHFGHGKLAVEAYNADMIAYYELQAQQLLALGEIQESTLLDLMEDDSMMAGGAQLYQAKCTQCHGQNGEGNIGPNLTDDYWLHGGKLTDIYHTVTEGVPVKGMLAWKNQLGPAEILSVSAYVGSLRGSSPANAKAAQGKLEPYDPAAILADEATEEPAGEETSEEAPTESEAETETAG
jgi:cytochrome c oxidase cbb3-type subunit 3